MFVVSDSTRQKLAQRPEPLRHFCQHVIYHRSDIVNGGIGDTSKIPVLGFYFYFRDVRTTREGARDGEFSHSVERMRVTFRVTINELGEKNRVAT